MKQVILYAMFTVLLVATGLSSCDDHDVIDSNARVGDVVFADHSIMSYGLFSVDTFAQVSRTPVAVVFAEKTDNHPALAVLLREPQQAAFADTIGATLGTSTVLDSCTGRSNTAALYATGKSPAASALFTFDSGRSAFLPCVYEARLLSSSLGTVNPIIRKLGGTPVSTESTVWYWTSTEVSGNGGYQAWSFNANTGSIQPTPKTLSKNIRAIIELE